MKPLYLKTESFWDLHIHGVSKHDFIFTTPKEVFEVCTTLGKGGVGFFAPTLLTSDLATLNRACQVWGAAIDKFYLQTKPFPKDFAFPIGIHAEGPFLNPKMAGAHPQQWLAKPSGSLLEKLRKSSKNHLKILTLAPELPKAMDLIQYAVKKGIRIQLGHSLASSQIALKAVSNGATGITHLFNAMRFHHRDPGLWSALTQNQVTAELITDLKHLDPEFTFFCAESLKSKLYSVSDRCSLESLGNLRVFSKSGLAYTQKTNTMAGSTLTLTEHPHEWKKHGKKPRFELFFLNQKSFFKTEIKHLKRQHPELFFRKIRFDSKTYQFQGWV